MICSKFDQLLEFSIITRVLRSSSLTNQTEKYPKTISTTFGVYHIPAPEGCTCEGAWSEHYGPPQGEFRLKVCQNAFHFSCSQEFAKLFGFAFSFFCSS
ncbi:hypothetical protein OESDEN_22241 [Oesophagostomum dentatum]|uniref:Uncharacterized protein n=1 Tax=Oesophagostomum dentatum TaxID=61180 RepID=A0A0B1RZR3_OESDE|nr:hypothetical protein OESDEN_22241 [Oesophagostomum dentatum]